MRAGGDVLAGGIVQLESVFLVLVQGGCPSLLRGLHFGVLGDVQDFADSDVVGVGDFRVRGLKLFDCDVEFMGNFGQAVTLDNSVGHDFLRDVWSWEGAAGRL